MAALSEPGRSWVRAFVAVALVGGVIMGLYLWVYPPRGLATPIGWDNAEYVWRTRLAQEVGVRGVPEAVPPGMRVKEGRPAYPVVSATLSSLEPVGVLALGVVLPAVVAAAFGLAAGAFLRAAFGLPWWALLAAAATLGVSMNVVLMYGYGYVDNLMAAAVLMVGVLATVVAVEDRRGLVPAILLLGAGGVIHGAFFAVVAGTLAVTAAVHLPASWRAWRSGGSGLLDTPSARLAAVGLGSGAVAAATLFAAVSTPPAPRLNRPEFAKKLREDIPRYRFWLLLPLAGLGALSPARPDGAAGGRRRFVLLLLLSWSGVTLAGYLAYQLSTFPIPANRLLLFALALPMLAVLAVLRLGELLRGRSRRAAAAAVAIGLGGLVALSELEWARTPANVDPVKMREGAAADAYLRTVGAPASTPVVFIVDDRGPLPAATVPHMRDHIFDAIATERIRNTYVYVGSVEGYLSGRPTLIEGRRQYNAVSRRFFDRMEHTYAGDPVVLIASSMNVTHYHPWVDDRPETRYRDQGLAVVRGPLPPAESIEPVDPAGPPGALKLAALSSATLALLGIAGLGWALALLGRWLAPMEALAVAPAVGIAAIVMIGVFVDRLGVRLDGAAGAFTLPAISGAGWGVHLLGRRRAAAGRGAPEPPPPRRPPR